MKSVVSTTEKSRIPEAINEVLKVYFERLEENLPTTLSFDKRRGYHLKSGGRGICAANRS